jgi:peptidoglycan/LPS O-acetylase OafA/YrhL
LIIFVILGTLFPFFVDGNSGILTLSCVNSFGIGGLLAYIEIYKKSVIFKFYKLTLYSSISITLLLIVHNLYSPISFFSERLAISIIAVFLITHCLLKPKSFAVDKILGNRFLNFIGIISYGIYLYHNIVPKYWNFVLHKLKMNFNNFEFSYLEFFLQTSFIIVLSYFSWILLEKPILNLKKYLNE